MDGRTRQVPQQTEKESCGYRMLYNLNKICSQENIETIEDEELALEGYTLEIIKILKKGQQDNANQRNTQKETRTREEERGKTGIEGNIEEEKLKGQEVEQELGKRDKIIDKKVVEKQGKLAKKRKEKDIEEEKLSGQGIEQDLEEREKVMDEKIIEKRGKLAKKRKEREEEEEENKHKKKQKNAEGEDNEYRKQLKRTRQQQKQKYPEEQQEERKLRSGKIRKTNPVERSLSSRCRDAPD